MNEDRSQTTRLLKAVHAGDQAAAEKLLPLVYAELHRVANAYMRRERPDHTLQPTALINEAYLRLIQEDVDWNSREHFIGFAAHVMRRVLVDYARARNADHRGGKMERVELQDHFAISPDRLEEVSQIDRGARQVGEAQSASGQGRRAAILWRSFDRADWCNARNRAAFCEDGTGHWRESGCSKSSSRMVAGRIHDPIISDEWWPLLRVDRAFRGEGSYEAPQKGEATMKAFWIFRILFITSDPGIRPRCVSLPRPDLDSHHVSQRAVWL